MIRRRVSGLPVLLVLLAAACGAEAPMPDGIVALRVETEAREVTLGKGFPLSVTRVWASGRPPGEWSDERLFPLYLSPTETTTRDDGRFVEEVRRFTAYAFEPGKLIIPPPELVPDVADRLALTVVPSLDAAAPGEPDLPGGLLTEPTPWWPWFAAFGVLLAAGLLLRFRRTTPVTAPESESPPVPAPPAPHEIALRRIERLRGLSPDGRAATQEWHVEAAAVLRNYLAARFALPTERMTTPECLAAAAGVTAIDKPQREALRAFLRHCDGVKFARERPDRTERSRVLDLSVGFVTDTAGEDA